MYSGIPNEILKQIFSDPVIRKKDLLQLQLTCKQWSPVAQKYLYENIQLSEINDCDDHSAIKRRFASLIQSLLFANSQLGKCIKSFNFGSLFYNTTCDSPFEGFSFSIAMLAHLCPNLTSISGSFDLMEYLKTVSHLHRKGYFQRLEFVKAPIDINRTVIATYHATILEFKETIKDITITDGISNTLLSAECLIPPTSLQLFTSVERVELREFARVHLYRIKNYVSNCGPQVRSLDVQMLETTTASLQDEYNEQSGVQPRESIQELSIYPEITTNEMAFIMRMFPSLKKIYLAGLNVLDKINFNQADMQVVTQVLNYLSLITDVHCQFMLEESSTGLDLLPHVAKAIDIKELSIESFPLDAPIMTVIELQRPAQAFKATPNGFSVYIRICFTQAPALFARALGNLKGSSIESIDIGCSDDNMLPQKIEQRSIDYIVDNYKALQDLTFTCVEFPPHAFQSAKQRVEHLRNLCLNECTITEDYLTALAWKFQQIDHFELYDSIMSDSNKMKIHLPYTTLKTISLNIGLGKCHLRYIESGLGSDNGFHHFGGGIQ
ncbi:hypothetical protein MBANPS3_009055 [Mucor bainieri]